MVNTVLVVVYAGLELWREAEEVFTGRMGRDGEPRTGERDEFRVGVDIILRYVSPWTSILYAHD